MEAAPMKTTLNLVEHVLALGRRYQELGRHRDALALFTRLSGFRELPADAAEETQVRLAEMHLKRRRFTRARRHLAAALHHQPDSARYHYLMATALHSDERGDLERAAEHFARALALEPNNVRCQADAGLLAVRLGRTDEGLEKLRKAVEAAPDDAEVMGRLIKGLRLAGRTEEARAALRAALFRNPRAPRFRRLWAEFRVDGLRRRQAERSGRRSRQTGEDPVVLPFVRAAAASRSGEVSPTILRTGAAARHLDQRNVQ
jgi:tetratricopeptide (TPR) repeat protein